MCLGACLSVSLSCYTQQTEQVTREINLEADVRVTMYKIDSEARMLEFIDNNY